MPSSPGASQRANSSQDVPMTDQTDDDPYEVCTAAITFLLRLIIIELPVSLSQSVGFSMQDDENDEAEFEMYRVQGTLREWVTRDEVRRFIAKKFKEFLLTYVNPKNEHGDFEYLRQINEMVSGKSSGMNLVLLVLTGIFYYFRSSLKNSSFTCS